MRDIGIITNNGHHNVLIDDHSPGTIKDRRSYAIARRYIHGRPADRPDVLALISAGNAAISLAQTLSCYRSLRHIKVRALMDPSTSTSRRKLVERRGAEVILADLSRSLTPEEITGIARHSPEEKITDVTSGFEGVHEVELPIGYRVKNVICPVGTGELFAGLYGQLRSQPGIRLVGVTVESRESIASVLRGPHRPYQHVLDAVVARGHMVMHLTEEQVRVAIRLVPDVLRKHFCPSSAVVFGAIDLVSGFDDTILVNTGVGVEGSLASLKNRALVQ